MVDYLRIARAYLRGTTAAEWCFMLLCLVTYSVAGEEVGRNQSAILGGVLSRKSYMAMFAYFNAFLLGVLLRDNIAHPWASVLPRYRQKHLVVAALIALFFLAIPMFSMEFVGTSDIAPTSVAVIFLTCLAAGLWTLQQPVVVIPFLVFVFASSSSFPLLAAFLAGTYPAASAVIAFMSLLALWALASRMLTLKEETFEYATARMWGDLFRGRGPVETRVDYLAALPADQRASLQNFDPQKVPFNNLKQVDNLAGYSERSLWQRLQLWRLGTTQLRASASVGQQFLISFIFIAGSVYIAPLLGAKNPAREFVVIMSLMLMTNPFNIWLLWSTRLHRLGYESLRPRTRQEFVRELGLALLWDMTECWLGGLLLMGIGAALWAPELLQVENILLFILGTGVGQLFTYGMMGIWLLKLLRRGMVVSILCALCPFLAMAIWFLWIGGSIGLELNIAIASVLAAVSVATIALAYRRWCRADLD